MPSAILFLVFGTWLMSFAPFTAKAYFTVLARTLEFGYAPLVFSVFESARFLSAQQPTNCQEAAWIIINVYPTVVRIYTKSMIC